MTDLLTFDPTRGSAATDLRLVVADLDGTLLDERGQVPAGFWPLLERMRARGIVFVPASGRQYATLASLFARAAAGMPFIAENGMYTVRDGVELGSVVLDRAFVREAVTLLRGLGRDLGVVVCGKRSAYVERADAAFLAEARKYYVALATVEDLLAVEDEVIKVAVFDFGDAEAGTAPRLAPLAETHQVVVSGEHWVDVMAPGANKGSALRALQRELGITRAQTAAFGDYLNDLELLDAAGLSFAMANAHPEVLARARFVAPANVEEGVVTTLAAMIP